jgi:uncharacterized repeat protein (TIGR03987 family)
MKPVLIAGMTIVNVALICYIIFIYNERKTRKAGAKVVTFLTIGVIFDITATICMIAGSTQSPFTLHGILGYSSLTGMLTDSVLIWRHLIRNGADSLLSSSLHKYSLIAFAWWIAAYVTGSILVMMR